MMCIVEYHKTVIFSQLYINGRNKRCLLLAYLFSNYAKI